MSIQIEKRPESKDRRIIIKFYESLRMISKIDKIDLKRKGNSLTIEELRHRIVIVAVRRYSSKLVVLSISENSRSFSLSPILVKFF